MFREMRRKRQQLSKEECERILRNGSAGVLGLHGYDGYPYTVPISFVLDGDRLIFHSAKSGHKIDAITQNSKASFCVIDQDLIVSEKLTTYFRSVIVFGKIRIVEDEAEKREMIEKLAVRYAPDLAASLIEKEIEKTWRALALVELKIEHMSGKEAIELVNKENH